MTNSAGATSSTGLLSVANARASAQETIDEIKHECIPTTITAPDSKAVLKFILSFIYIPILPAFYKPGWLLNYVRGPFNGEWLDSFLSDVWAGVVVALTLIPQGISYAGLANMPIISGLYCAVIPGATYTFLGTGLQLAVGPVAIVSLLMGSLVTKYMGVPYSATAKIPMNPDPYYQLASQVTFACGIYLICLGILKCGNFIRFISQPVMSGFTSAAAMTIGASQLKSAFNLPSSCPQQGQVGYDYQYQVYQWYLDNWDKYDTKNKVYYTNYIAINICFGIYIPLAIIYFSRQWFFPETPERKKKIWFKVISFLANILPLFAIIIGASLAQGYNTNPQGSNYAKGLKIVGTLPSGLNIFRPLGNKFDWGSIFNDTLPLTLISFMESYSVARALAVKRNELHILNANQELFAVGMANMLGSFASAFPVSGSFSRSSLNCASGARTPLSKATTMSIVCIALSTLTSTFQYIPNAALAAIIWVAIIPLVHEVTYAWPMWKHSKQDFFVIAVTFVITFAIDTAVGLAVGLGVSVLILLYNAAYLSLTAPTTYRPADKPEVTAPLNLPDEGVVYVRINNDLTFLSGPRIRDYIQQDIVETQFESIKAVAIDFQGSRVLDYTGLLSLQEILYHGHIRGVKVMFLNATPYIAAQIAKFGLDFDDIGSFGSAPSEKSGVEEAVVVTDKLS